MELGSAYRIARQPARALACGRRAARLQPGWREGFAVQGLALEDLGQFVQARRAFRQVLHRGPDDPQALYHLMGLAARAGDHAEAIEHATALLHQRPQDPYLLGIRGRAYLELNELTASEADLTRALALEGMGGFAQDGMKRVQAAKHAARAGANRGALT